jgi:hypothetical protein
MRRRPVAQFALGFRQRDVETRFAGLCAFQQELQRYGGLAGAGRAFDEKEVTAGKSA